MKAFIFLIALASVFTLGCKKYEQPELTPVNQDCSCASEVSADFEILELEGPLGLDPEGTDSDTVFINANVIFRAKEEGAEYTWYIGSEVLNTQEVGRNFPAAFSDQDITVSLVVRKQANTICFPNDDGYDSISRTFYVQNYTASDLTSTYDNGVTLMEGTYRMMGSGVADSFDITIDYIDRNPPPQPIEQIDIVNFDGNGTVIMIPRNAPTRKTYHGLWVQLQGTSNKCLEGKFINTLDGGAIFQYSYCEQVNGEYVYIDRELKGRKL